MTMKKPKQKVVKFVKWRLECASCGDGGKVQKQDGEEGELGLSSSSWKNSLFSIEDECPCSDCYVRREVNNCDAMQFLSFCFSAVSPSNRNENTDCQVEDTHDKVEKKEPFLPSVVTSLPDIIELQIDNVPTISTQVYEKWLTDIVAHIVSNLKEGAVAIFYQTDVRVLESSAVQGYYIDKSFWVTKGALAAGGRQLFHKVG